MLGKWLRKQVVTAFIQYNLETNILKISDRDPTENDLNYNPGSEWTNTDKGQEWILVKKWKRMDSCQKVETKTTTPKKQIKERIEKLKKSAA